MASLIAQAYVRTIKAGLKTIDDVPEKYKAEVQAILDQQ